MKLLKENRIYSFDEIYAIAERLIEMNVVTDPEKGDYIALLVKEDKDSTWDYFEATGSYRDAYDLTDDGVGPYGKSMIARIKTNEDLEENANKAMFCDSKTRQVNRGNYTLPKLTQGFFMYNIKKGSDCDVSSILKIYNDRNSVFCWTVQNIKSTFEEQIQNDIIFVVEKNK